ncbi:MAG: sigma-54 dependent transcriptional regulator [Candidatus Brocadiia bacterium]
MDDRINILVCYEEGPVSETISAALEQGDRDCVVATDPRRALDEAGSGRYDIVLTGIELDGHSGMEVLRAARGASPDCQVIVVTPSSQADEAVNAIKEGALYYLQTPVNPVELSAMVDRAAEHVLLVRDRAAMQSELAERYGFANIVGNSRPMQRVFRKMRQIANTSATVLIQGETGTGKELVARAIHYNSDRRHNRFVPLNCAGLVESILESELFGHKEGAFTGAVSSREGLFEYANHGTLFLDEIGDMPVSSQTKLLRVLEYGEVVPVGSNEARHVDVRLIAATNQDLPQNIEDGTFRRDLFYRLNVMVITVPPLRERQSDIPLLIERFMREFSDVYEKPVEMLSADARKILFRYQWPGNVRELRNCIEHMIVATTDQVLGEDDLPDYMLEQMGRLREEPTLSALAGQPLEELEKLHIQRTLDLVDGNRERAAELLGIGERTLYRKIQKYDLR